MSDRDRIRIVEHAREWMRAAERAEEEEMPATAITFRNMAWLVEHPEGWKAFMEKEGRACGADSGM